jgi:hypothetical protein
MSFRGLLHSGEQVNRRIQKPLSLHLGKLPPRRTPETEHLVQHIGTF